MKLSIITITFNNLSGLEKTVKSVLEQSFTEFEFIIVDGNSSDGTKEWLSENSQKISKWISEKDSGIYNAQNKGIDLANGTYCLFLNAGDVLVKNNVLEKAFSLMNQETDIAYGDVLLSNENGVYSKKRHPEQLSSLYLLKEVVAHQSQFIRRELFMKFGKYNEEFLITADFEFFAKMFWEKNVNLQHIPLTVSDFNTEGLSSSVSQRKKIEEERKEIHKKYVPRF